MLAYIIRRFLYMLVTLFAISVIGFTVINLPPGNYVSYYITQLESQGGSMTQSEVQSLDNRYGLGQPIYVQYWKWIKGFVHGNFGESFEYQLPVSQLIWARLGYTTLIAVLTLLFTWIVAIPIGIYAATHQYGPGDYLSSIVGLAGLSIPNFLLALVFLVILESVFHFPAGGLFSRHFANAPWSLAKFGDFLKHVWLPVVVVGAASTGGLLRIMRGNLLDIINMQYVQAARARGLSESQVIFKHAVRNAIHPLIMLLGMHLPNIISGSLVVAIVLSLPTTGPLYFTALVRQDMYLAATFLMFLAALLVFGNFLADLLLAWIDPRIRYE